MVKVQAPALSLDASGSLANAIVFSKWKGRNYVRERVIPANPRSGGQVGIRAMFKFLTQDWTNLTAGNQATWEGRADDMVVSPFNAFLSYNMTRWRNFLGPSQEDPATATGTPATWGAASATAGVRQITISKAITVVADNWALGIHRATSTGFTIAFSNLVAVIRAASVATFSWVDSPLAAGTYYYNFSEMTDDGLRQLEDDEVTATVT